MCRACAGAGKTTLLLHAASSREGTYILTYNRSLCNSLQQMLDAMEMQSKCFTFHGLASHVFENVCYDDSILESEVEKAEKGEEKEGEEEWSRPACPPSVCVDEAQDLRPIHVRLLKLLFPTVPIWIVVGDERQLLYTFMDPPADVSYMRDPPFGPEGLEWERTNMTLSHRLTKQNCDLANHLLLLSASSDDLSSSRLLPPLRPKEGKEGPLPLLLTCFPYSWGETIHSLLMKEEPSSVLVLVRSTKATQSVSDMVNHLSSKGIPIYVHGQDGSDPKCSHGKMVVCTMHAAKGLQAETVIVAGVSSETEENPLHVAVTRAKRRLVLLQEARRPREDLMEAYRSGVVEGDKKTEERSKKPCWSAQTYSPNPLLRFKDLTYWSPSKVFTIQREVLFDPPSGETETPSLTIRRGERVEDVTDILLTSILFYLEAKVYGTPPQRVRDMLHPTVCSTYEERTRMLLSGDRTRTVLRGRSHLLPERGWSSLRSADCSTPKGCVTASVIAHAFNGFHNRIYSLLPVEEWLDESLFLTMAKRASSLDLEGSVFDALVVLSSECVCRVPILTKERECVFLTFESSTSGGRECLPACATGGKSVIVNVRTGLIERCSTEEEKESLLRLACSSS